MPSKPTTVNRASVLHAIVLTTSPSSSSVAITKAVTAATQVGGSRNPGTATHSAFYFTNCFVTATGMAWRLPSKTAEVRVILSAPTKAVPSRL